VVLWLFAWQFFIGVCGACTAFSLFSLPTPALAKEDEWFRAVANLIPVISRRRLGRVFVMPEKRKKE
jgi:fluoride ion exporter CrcB/FEX